MLYLKVRVRAMVIVRVRVRLGMRLMPLSLQENDRNDDRNIISPSFRLQVQNVTLFMKTSGMRFVLFLIRK